MIYWIVYFLLMIAVLSSFVGGLFFSRHRCKTSVVRTLFENFALSLLVFFLTFMAVEFYFKQFFAQSDAFRYTLASQNWYDRYWQENSLGYRDVEWTPEKLAGKTKVMVVGDSFVAGSGIADPEDRFADQLDRLLGDGYVVLNVASPGWDTVDEVDAIINYPYEPDILVLSYYINDIEGVAYERGAQRPRIRQDPAPWLAPLVENSHALNFLYWRLVRLGPQAWADTYWNDWLMRISTDPEIRWQHRQELLAIIKGAASEQIPLFVVLFPNLAAVDQSEPIIQPIIDLFHEHDIPVLNVSTLLAGRDPAETTVNAVDSHPNEAIHLEVAEHLYQMIQEWEKTPGDDPDLQ